MKCAGWIVLLSLVACSAGADASIAVGGTGTLSSPGAVPGVELHVAGGAGLYQPWGGVASLLLDGSAEVGWRPADSSVTGSATLLAQLGVQTGPFLSRLRLRALGQSTLGSPEASGEISASLPLGLEGAAASVQLDPEAVLYAGGRLLWSTSLTVSVEAIAAESLILSASATGDGRFPAQAVAEPGLSAEIGAEWLPSVPLTVSASIGVERRLSSNVETLDVGGTTVEVPGYWGYSLLRADLRATVVVGRWVDLDVNLAAEYRRGDYGVLEGATLLSEKAWSLDASASIALGVTLSRNVEITATLADTLTIRTAAELSNLAALGVEASLRIP